MGGWAKLGFAAWLAPGLTAAVIGLAVWVAVPAFWVGLALGAALLAIAGIVGLVSVLRRWAGNRFSPVRRRGPMPVAWRQWR